MKKILKAIVCFLLIATTILTLSGCKDKEDCIPETLGVAEGLYLYYDNYRSLTDGTQTERLLNDITVDGVTYTVDEYYINQVEYMTNKKEIFYCLETNKEGEDRKFFLWHYNYDTKESGYMRTFNAHLYVNVSENYVLAKSSHNSIYYEGVLYDGNLNFIQDGLEHYYLLKNEAYGTTDNSFYWWKNGNFYSVNINWARNYRKDVVFADRYAYLFANEAVYAVDMDTGEYVVKNFGGEQKFLDATNDYGRYIKSGKNVYFLTYTTIEPTDLEYFPLYAGCSLWVANELDAETVYTFPEKYEINFSNHSNANYINFETRHVPNHIFNRQRRAKRRSAYYDVQNDKVVFGANKNIEVKKETFVIGEYEFYTDKVHYGALMGSNYCYYLHRITNGKDEILQYHFSNDNNDELLNPVLFDDIYTK